MEEKEVNERSGIAMDNKSDEPEIILEKSKLINKTNILPYELSGPSSSSPNVEISSTSEKLKHYLTRDTEGKRNRKIPISTENINSSHNSLPHKSYYHPNAIRIDERHQRQLVATRDIQEGEIILQESPLMISPSAKVFPIIPSLSSSAPNGKNPTIVFRDGKDGKFVPICLGCYKNVQGLYKCSKCGWPVCNSECEKISDHADYECSVFASNPVSPIVHSNEYKKIKIIRCLLLRDKDPETWNKILNLDPHDDLRRSNQCAVSTTIALFKFIQQECHLKQFDGETINHVVGVNTVNSFNTINPRTCPTSEMINSESTKASLLFYQSSFLSHNCIPNTRCIISEKESSFIITVMASSPIRKGQILTHCYADLTRGTFQRRAELLENFYYSCLCRRCLDPTEHCTFFSALKCPKPGCKHGYLLPGNPITLELTSVWICNFAPKCDFIIGTSQVLELLQAVRKDLEECTKEAALGQNIFKEYENLHKVLYKYKGKILHPNHFLIMDIQYAIINCISKLQELVNEEEAIKLSQEQVVLSRSIIDVIDVLRPGNNRLRGNLLYFLHEGMLLTYLVDAKRKMAEPNSNFSITGKDRFVEILRIMKTGRDILMLEPPGSKEYIKSTKLSFDSSGLQPLIKYFNIQCDLL